MITAENYVLENWYSIPTDPEDILELMMGFAKMHVKAALEAACESLDRLDDLDMKIIRQSYPL